MNITKKQIKKPEIQKIAIGNKNQHTKDWVIDLSPFYNTDTLLENLVNEAKANKGKIEGLSMDFYRNIKKASFAFGLSTHIPIAETTREEYRTFLIQMIKDIERENDCKTAIEKALAETIASSYVRTLEYSKDLTLYTQDNNLSHEKNGYCNVLSKEIDRAYRIFLNASMTLKQLKNPLLDVNIKSKNTFFAQNQQFNNNQNKNND